MNYLVILKNMSLEDKIAICSGKDFWHTKDFEEYRIPSVMMTDGPHGLRKQNDVVDMLGLNNSVATTCFPTAVTSGATWNRKLVGKMAKAIGEEAKAEDVALVLGPGVNIKRSPLCGRNFEYFSEDPYVAGEMGAAYVEGMQETGIGTSLKHFAANSQEYKRFSSDSQMDERTLREIYLAAFEKVVKQSQPKTVMCAYPKLNGTYCSDNKRLLTDILREEWGFDGMVVTDWGGMNDRINSLKAGCDLCMPGGASYGEKAAIEAVKDGRLSESDVDACAARVLKFVFEGQKALDEKNSDVYDVGGHQKIAADVAKEGAVLLKNENQILPVSGDKKMVFIGHMAEEIRYQGAGSSHINPTKLVQVTDSMPDTAYVEGCDVRGNITEEGLEQVEKAAKEAAVAVVFAGLTEQYESEGFDRENMCLPQGHNQMIEAAIRGNENTVVILMGGSPMLLPWFDRVKAILYMGLCGQSGGEAVKALLSGEVNPSGKLTETWPLSETDLPCYQFYAGTRKNAQYREGIYVGYRYYDKAKVEVQFPFGYGLSYTAFAYENLQIEKSNDAQFIVQADITNTGGQDGAEVVQLYVGAPNESLYRAVKELKGFEKIFLKAGETKTVSFTIDGRSFALYQEEWKIPVGTYEILLASSVSEVRLTENIIITKDTFAAEYPVVDTADVMQPELAGSWYENPSGSPSKEQWEKLMGQKMDDDPKLEKGHFELNNTLLEMKDYNFIAKEMVESIEANIAKGMGIEPDYTNPEFRMTVSSSIDCSMRGMIVNSCGQFPEELANCIVEMANGHEGD